MDVRRDVVGFFRSVFVMCLDIVGINNHSISRDATDWWRERRRSNFLYCSPDG